jgi:hypothetical protein
MGNELSMWIQESITVSRLRSGQDIFHQNFADPCGFEGEVNTTSYKLTQKVLPSACLSRI